ncbi:NAD+ synthase [Roseisolibacter sp. H3M3-2]|nr:NAD+ synthase [Roseisolibacter sp. H3M3-2]MDF1502831.1 NAD+ synthase [Roseisolibacter sp. H3M3-2]
MAHHPLTLAVVQFRPVKGDYAANLARLGALLADCAALDPRPDVVQLPETALTGYFVEGGVRELAVTAGTVARDVDAAYRAAAGAGAPPLDVVVGFYEVWRDTLYNSAAYVTVGGDGWKIRHVHRKHFLPTYGLFDEERFVERGLELRAFDAPWGRAAILVCEDAWHSLTGTIAALDGARVVFVSSAAPARGIWPRDDGVPGPASVARWDRLVRDIAEEHGVFVALANLVGSEGGKSFGGSSSVVGPRGDVRVRGPVFEEAILSITVDLADLTRARADSPLLNDLRVAMPHLLRTLDAVRRETPTPLAYDPPAPAAEPHGLVAADERGAGAPDGRGTPEVGSPGAKASPSVPDPADASRAEPTRGGRPGRHDRADATATPTRGGASAVAVTRVALADHGLPPSLDVDTALLEEWLVAFLRDEFARRGFQKAVVGCSGGVDSAVTTFLAARALGPANVVAVRMPYRTSSADSLAHAQLVIDACGVEAQTIDISPAVDGYLGHEPDADPARRGNVMARTRMIVLFDQSAKYRALPLGTGNKTERLFGYFTWHADDSPPVNPLGDLYKTQVWALARHLGVPSVIVDKPASADLVAGQTDEGDFGISYARADLILNWLLHGYAPDALVARGFAADEVERVRKRLSGTHWKRRLPAVAMVSPTAIGEAYLRPVDY